MRSHHAIALIRAMAHASEKPRLVARLHQILEPPALIGRLSAADVDTLTGLIEQDPRFRTLIPVIASAYFRVSFRGDPKALRETVFTRAPNDTPEIAASVSQLRIATGHPLLDIDTDFKILLATGTNLLHQLLHLAANRTGEDGRNVLLLLCREILVRRLVSYAGHAYRLLQNIDEARPVALRDDARSRALSLPPALATR